MTLTREQHLRLLRLCRRASEFDLAIGAWLFGPSAGTFYVQDLRTGNIETGEAGMSLADLTAWFARFDTVTTGPKLEIGAHYAA